MKSPRKNSQPGLGAIEQRIAELRARVDKTREDHEAAKEALKSEVARIRGALDEALGVAPRAPMGSKGGVYGQAAKVLKLAQEGLGPDEIAERLHTSPGNVERSLRSLRKNGKLEPEPAAPPARPAAPVHPRLAELRAALEELGLKRSEYSGVVAGLDLRLPPAELVKQALAKLRPPPRSPAAPSTNGSNGNGHAAAAGGGQDLERQLVGFQADTIESVRAILASTVRMAQLDRDRGKGAGYHTMLASRVIEKVGGASPLGKLIQARKEGMKPSDFVPCSACGLRGHTAADPVCPRRGGKEAE